MAKSQRTTNGLCLALAVRKNYILENINQKNVLIL